ncbi:Type I restriction-modification system, specificity subunit S [Bacillus badius]|nr:Type I restriction-modification system, specificity subunit S [Bacillus badius]
MEVYSVTNSKGFTKSTEYFSKEIFSKDLSNYKLVKRNQFAYNPSRINVGSIAFLSNADFALVSPLYIVFEVDKNHLFPDYLLRYLKSHYGNVQIRNNTEGSVRDSLKYKGLEKIKVPIPPLNDQIRIATVLSRAEALIAKRKESIKELDELLKSHFLEMFGDPLKNEKGWEKKRINEIAEVRIGPFGSLLHAEDYVKNGIPLINPSHIVDGKIIPDNKQSLTQEKFEELKAYHLKINDIVVARRGEIGRCAVVTNSRDLLCGTGSMFIRINDNYCPILLQFQVSNTTLKHYLERKAKGVTMKNLNSKILGNLMVLNPPQEIQNRFSAVYRKVETLKAKYHKSLIELENLFGSLSQLAFKGELDLSKVEIETEYEIIEEGEKGGSSVDIGLTDTKEYSEVELLKVIQLLPGGTFSFNTLMSAIEAASFVQMPEYDEVKEQVYRMLEGVNPVLSQYFDTTKREIMLRVNR